MSNINLCVVRCDGSTEQWSTIVETILSMDEIEERAFEQTDQELAANEERELHNAAHHAEHGPVTYVQQVHDGGFSVFVGEPGNLVERFFGPGEFVAFMDDQGPGHASKVGPEGVRRTLRVLRGHLDC